MFSYYLQLGLHSLKRNPVLTALMVIGIGLGIADGGCGAGGDAGARQGTDALVFGQPQGAG